MQRAGTRLESDDHKIILLWIFGVLRARGGRRKANPPDFRRCPARPARVRRRFRPDFPRRGTGGYARRAHARNRLRRRNLRVPLPAHCTGWRGDSEAIRRQNYSDARNPGAHAQSGPDIREKPQAKPEALFLLMIAETPEKTWRMRRKARKPRHGNDRIHSKKRLARLRPRRRKATGKADLEYPRGKAGCKVEIGIRNCEPEYFIALPCAS